MGAILVRAEKLEKGFNKASRGHVSRQEMKTARQILKQVKAIATKLDDLNVGMSADIAKANQSKEVDEVVLRAKNAAIAHKQFEKLLRALSKCASAVVSITPKTLKKENPVDYRGLKVLSSDIVAFAAYCTYLLKDRKEQIDNIGKDISAEERKSKVADKAMLQIDKAVKRARSSIQKIKATPTEEVWNKQFLFAGRDVHMALVSLVKAQNQQKFPEFPPKVTDLYERLMKDWDTGKFKELHANATEKDILARTKHFSGQIKDIAKFYNIR